MTDETLSRAVPGAAYVSLALPGKLIRERYQLAGGLASAAALPLLLWIATGTPAAAAGYARTTLMVCLAVVLCQFFVRALARYPAPSSLSTSLPAVSA